MRTRDFIYHFLLYAFLILSIGFLSVRCNKDDVKDDDEIENEIKTVLLLGDSISVHYEPFLKEYLADYVQDAQGEKQLDVQEGINVGNSQMALAYLQSRVDDSAINSGCLLLLNCGLDDIKRDLSTNKIQVSEQEYRQNLEAIVQLLQKKHIQLIWVRTTPVVDSIHNTGQITFHRYAADVQLYNQIADEVCAKYEIREIDLFTFTEKLGTDQYTNHVYYKETARNLQGAYIAGSILSYLNISRW